MTELQKLLAEVAEKRGYMRGRLDSVAKELRDDPVLRELVRVRAWAREGRTSLEDVPAGWPDGVDGEQAVGEIVGERMRPLYENEPAVPGDNDSAFTRAFRKGVNHE